MSVQSPAQTMRRDIWSLANSDQVTHVETLPPRAGVVAEWPSWVDRRVVVAARDRSIEKPWRHQAQAASTAWAGQHVALATGTASGKSLAYQLPMLTAALTPRLARIGGRGQSTLYLAPTKALAADQATSLAAFELAGVRVGLFDGDTPAQERDWVREYAEVVLSNPDAMHHSLLPGHQRWASFLRGLRFVVIDEAHSYRGLFGSHVALIMRRLRRVAARYGADPVFITVTATSADPGANARSLTGLEAAVVDRDDSHRGSTQVLLWQPRATLDGEQVGAEVAAGQLDLDAEAEVDPGMVTHRSALAETAELLQSVVLSGRSALAFVASRRGAEVVASSARRGLIAHQAEHLVAAYRAGYLPEERRVLEADLRAGRVCAVATTSALELGIDIRGMDAVVMCGWPGRRSSFWQRVGRAGRHGGRSIAVLVATDDPLDQYLVHHPEAIFGPPVEVVAPDPANPYVLAPQLCAAAAEIPLVPADAVYFGSEFGPIVDRLVAQGALRSRPTGWYWTRGDRAAALSDLRGMGGDPVQIIEHGTARVLGTVDAGAAHHSVHAGAVYLHQGRPWRVLSLDVDGGCAIVGPDDGTTYTRAQERYEARLLRVRAEYTWGSIHLALGDVEVTSQITGYVRRRLRDDTVIAQLPLDLPARTLVTTGVWWTLPESELARAGISGDGIPGAAHAAEHAAISMLPLVATCDRWDIGGVSTARHPDTGLPTIVVHDAHPGGAGFAERGFAAAATWLTATRDMIAQCPCMRGCPSCVQSPKCGSGNSPLDKDGAVALLSAVLASAPGHGGG